MKKVISFLKQPKVWFAVTVYAVTLCMGALALMFVITGKSENIFAYICYASTALFLAYSIYTIVIFVPKAKRKILDKMQSHKVSERFIKDFRFRALIFAGASLIISVGYVIFNGVVALKSSSVWFGALAGYYLLLAILRGSVVLSTRKDNTITDEKYSKIRQLKLHRICGIVLLVTILALSFAIMQMVVKQESFKYVGLMIYAGAAYTFTKVIVAILNFVKAKKRKDLTVETIRNINLADAAVSILALQTAMFQSFAVGQNMSFANAAVGAAVCAIILGLGTFMIIKSCKELRKMQKEQIDG